MLMWSSMLKDLLIPDVLLREVMSPLIINNRNEVLLVTLSSALKTILSLFCW